MILIILSYIDRIISIVFEIWKNFIHKSYKLGLVININYNNNFNFVVRKDRNDTLVFILFLSFMQQLL